MTASGSGKVLCRISRFRGKGSFTGALRYIVGVIGRGRNLRPSKSMLKMINVADHENRFELPGETGLPTPSAW